MNKHINKLVLDTNIFINPKTRNLFGNSPTEAFKEFLKNASKKENIQFFMPPSIFKELMDFVDKKTIGSKLLLTIQQKSPKKYELKVPGFLLYELIDDIRKRVNKGLRLSEKAIRKVKNQKITEDIISNLRDKYRSALREGIIDSREDVDLILLAKELEATLVSTDKGVITWAEKLGISWLEPDCFKKLVA